MVYSRLCFVCFLGYLYLGALDAASSCRADGSSELSSDASAVVRVMQAAGESVQVTRTVQTVLDSGELQVLHTNRTSCSAECQTDFEPMWYFGPGAAALTSSESGGHISQLSRLPSTHGLIDMRNCEQFTVARLEDIRDPSAQSFVMVQTTGMRVSSTDSSENRQPDASIPGLEPSSPSLERIGSSPAMFVGHDTHWKREMELPRVGMIGRNMELSQHPAEMDSGIWDMVQALGAGNDSSGHVNLFNSVNDRNDCSEFCTGDNDDLTSNSDSDLKGTYRMYNVLGGPQSDMVETTRHSNVKINTDGGWRKDHGGGLTDALEPLAVVDFVVHRVEADNDYCEKVKSPGSERNHPIDIANKGHVSVDQKNMTEDQLEAREDGKPVQPRKVELQANHYDNSASGSNTPSTQEEACGPAGNPGVHANRSSPVKSVSSQGYERAEQLHQAHGKADKTHKDVVEITSVRLARHSTRRRTAGRYKYWRESHMRSRKAKSADTSPRCSSLIDVGLEPRGLSAGVGSLSLARSSEFLDNQSPERDTYSKLSDQFSKGTGVVQHHHISSPCDSWPNFGRSSRIGSGNLPVGSLDWLGDSSLPSMGRAPSAPCLDLYTEPELTDFEKFPDWMRDLPEALHTVPLSSLSIPGKELH